MRAQYRSARSLDGHRRGADLPLVARFTDYYAGVEIAVEDLGALVFELRRLEASPSLAAKARTAAGRFRRVVEAAILANKPLLALAD